MANMEDTVSAAGHALAVRRWGTRGLDRAVETVISRSADLSGSQRAAIEAAIEASPDTEATQ